MKRILIASLLFCACISISAQESVQYDPESSDLEVLTAKVEAFEKMTPREFRIYQFEKQWLDFPKYEVRIGYSGYPMMDWLNFGDSNSVFYKPASSIDLDGIYAPRKDTSYMTGNFFGEFSWHIKKWLTLAGGLYFNGMYGSTINPATGGVISRESGVSVTFLPSVRFYWKNRVNFRVYSSIGLGINVAHFGYTSVLPTFQLTPVGISAGKKVFFFAEYTFGMTSYGGQIGIGYRF